MGNCLIEVYTMWFRGNIYRGLFSLIRKIPICRLSIKSIIERFRFCGSILQKEYTIDVFPLTFFIESY